MPKNVWVKWRWFWNQWLFFCVLNYFKNALNILNCKLVNSNITEWLMSMNSRIEKYQFNQSRIKSNTNCSNPNFSFAGIRLLVDYCISFKHHLQSPEKYPSESSDSTLPRGEERSMGAKSSKHPLTFLTWKMFFQTLPAAIFWQNFVYYKTKHKYYVHKWNLI